MKIKSVIGMAGSDRTSNWLMQWEKFFGRHVHNCAARGCHKKAEVVAEVERDIAESHRRFIVPLCVECSRRAEHLDILLFCCAPVATESLV